MIHGDTGPMIMSYDFYIVWDGQKGVVNMTYFPTISVVQIPPT